MHKAKKEYLGSLFAVKKSSNSNFHRPFVKHVRVETAK